MDSEREELQSFDPAGEGTRFRLWVRVVTPDRPYYYIYWRRVAGALAALALMAWLGLAGGAWAFLRYQREWKEVSYVDLALYPFRKKEFKASLAEYYRAAAAVHLKEKNYYTAYTYFMSALRHAPENLEARKQAAINLVRYGLVPKALDVLADGLKYNPDLEYLKLLFGWMLEARQDDRLLTLATSYLPAKPDADIKHRFVALEAAIAHGEHGRYDKVEQFIADWGLTDSLEGHILLARCDWERGFRERAVVRLEGQLPRFPQRDELLLQLVRYYRDLGRYDESRRYALLRQLNDPRGPGPRLDLAHGYRMTNDRAGETREIDTYLTEFGADLRSLHLLADYAADTVNATLLDRVVKTADAHGFPANEFDLARVQLALGEQHFDDALAFSDPARRPPPEGSKAIPSLIDGLRIVALLAKKDVVAAEGQLDAFLAATRLRTQDARLLAAELNAIGAVPEARIVLERISQVDPTDQGVVGEIIRLDAAARNREGLISYVPKFLTLRRPTAAVLEEALLALDETKDAALMAQIRAALLALRTGPTPKLS